MRGDGMKEMDGKKKDALRLRIQYLRQSKDYEEFCNWQRNVRDNHATQPECKVIFDQKVPIPKKLESKLYMISNFIVFGDIHSYNFSFEKWCKSLKNNTNIITQQIPVVEDYASLVARDIDVCIGMFKQTHDREPNLEEFKKSFSKMIAESCFLYTRALPWFDRKESKILSDYGRILAEKKKDPKVKKMGFLFKTGPLEITTNSLPLDQLRRYLDIFGKFKRGMTWVQIAESNEYYKVHYEPHSKDKETMRREIYKDKEHAQNIINNVERGIFPGEYGGVTARK